MSKARSLEVKNQFARYKRIKSSTKELNTEILRLEEKKGDSRYEACEVPLLTVDELLTLRCDVKREVVRSLHIQLFCKAIQQDPCYRFESCGAPHTNKRGPLRGRRIPTPHFHEYDETGCEVAYQTPEVLDSNQDVLKSRDAVIAHFCDVHGIHYNGHIKLIPATLFPPEDVVDDILKGVPFEN